MEKYSVSYGESLTIQSKRIYYSVSGVGNNVIVLLAAKKSPAPLIEMKALAHFLNGKYTVVTMDYLGSGLSSNYNSNRTLENITVEIHNVLSELGFNRYSIAACEEAGLYSLYYANKYPEEVSSIIGINSHIAEQIDDEEWAYRVRDHMDLKREFHKSKIAHLFAYIAAANCLKKSRDYRYSKQDINFYAKMKVYQLEDITLLDYYKCNEENYNTLKGVRYPAGISICFILSRRYGIKNWINMHKTLLNNERDVITIINEKGPVHLKKAKKIASIVDGFLL